MRDGEPGRRYRRSLGLGQQVIPTLLRAVVLHVPTVPELDDRRLACRIGDQVSRAGDKEKSVHIVRRSSGQIGKGQRINILDVVGISFDGRAEILLRRRIVLQLKRGEAGDAVQQSTELRLLLGEIRVGGAIRLGHFGNSLQATLGVLFGIRPFLGSALVVGQQHQGASIVRIDREEPIRSVDDLGLIVCLLVGSHQ